MVNMLGQDSNSDQIWRELMRGKKVKGRVRRRGREREGEGRRGREREREGESIARGRREQESRYERDRELETERDRGRREGMRESVVRRENLGRTERGEKREIGKN